MAQVTKFLNRRPACSGGHCFLPCGLCWFDLQLNVLSSGGTDTRAAEKNFCRILQGSPHNPLHILGAPDSPVWGPSKAFLFGLGGVGNGQVSPRYEGGM